MTRAISFDFHARATTFLVSLLVLCVLTYGALILLMVEETAYRARAENASRTATGELSVLEQKYISAEESITLERAQALGFIDAPRVVRVARDFLTALSVRSE